MSTRLQWSDLTIGPLLGTGAAGAVYAAQLRRPYAGLPRDTTVAVKRYKRWVIEQPEQYERIFRELEAGRSVRHPNIVHTLAIIADPDGLPALVMRCYHGSTLEECLARHRAEGRRVPTEEAFAIIGRLASALATLHEKGIVHRDVKPANILLESGQPILMDLGVVTSAHLSQGTTTIQFLGTIRYAANEYLFEDEVGPASDSYSLGAIAFELFLGERFGGDDEHWARLIRARVFDDDPISWPKMFRPVSESEEVRVATAAERMILSLLDPNPVRRVNLRSLADACERRFWTETFSIDVVTDHDSPARVSIEDPLVPKFGVWRALRRRFLVHDEFTFGEYLDLYDPTLQDLKGGAQYAKGHTPASESLYHLSEAVHELRTRVGRTELEELVRWLDAKFWTDHPFFYFGDSPFSGLESIGALKYVYPEKRSFWGLDDIDRMETMDGDLAADYFGCIHEAVVEAYALGLLDDMSQSRYQKRLFNTH